MNLWPYWSVEDGGGSFSKDLPGRPNKVQKPALLKRLIRKSPWESDLLSTLFLLLFFFFFTFLFVTWWNFLCALPSVLVAGLRQYLQPTSFSLGTKSTLLKRFSSTLSDIFQSDYCPLHEYWMWMTMQGCGIYWEIQVKCLTQEIMIEPKQAGETSDLLYGDGRSPEGTEIPNHKQPWGPSKPVLQLATKLSHDNNSINHNPPHCNFLIPIIYWWGLGWVAIILL